MSPDRLAGSVEAGHQGATIAQVNLAEFGIGPGLVPMVRWFVTGHRLRFLCPILMLFVHVHGAVSALPVLGIEGGCGRIVTEAKSDRSLAASDPVLERGSVGTGGGLLNHVDSFSMTGEFEQ